VKTIEKASASAWFFCALSFFGIQSDSWGGQPIRPVVAQVDQISPQSLKDAYVAALNRSEVIGIQQELLIQSKEVQSQALGAILPTVNGVGNALWQASPSNATGTSISPSNQQTVKITGDQPLFKGFRDFAALRQRKDLVGAQEYTLQAAARQLFYDLSGAYYNVLANESDVRNYKQQIEVNRQRLKELNQFYNIGRSQLTDVLTFESNIASLETQLETSIGLREIAKDTLAYVTGWKRDTPLRNTEPSFQKANDIDFHDLWGGVIQTQTDIHNGKVDIRHLTDPHPLEGNGTKKNQSEH